MTEPTAPQPTTPIEVFELIHTRAMTLTQAAFMESGRAFPTDHGTVVFMKTLLGLGVAAAAEHFAEHPEHLALAGTPICTVCREPVQTLQVGADPAAAGDGVVMRIAWPCGHRQS